MIEDANAFGDEANGLTEDANAFGDDANALAIGGGAFEGEAPTARQAAPRAAIGPFFWPLKANCRVTASV